MTAMANGIESILTPEIARWHLEVLEVTENQKARNQYMISMMDDSPQPKPVDADSQWFEAEIAPNYTRNRRLVDLLHVLNRLHSHRDLYEASKEGLAIDGPETVFSRLAGGIKWCVRAVEARRCLLEFWEDDTVVAQKWPGWNSGYQFSTNVNRLANYLLVACGQPTLPAAKGLTDEQALLRLERATSVVVQIITAGSVDEAAGLNKFLEWAKGTE